MVQVLVAVSIYMVFDLSTYNIYVPRTQMTHILEDATRKIEGQHKRLPVFAKTHRQARVVDNEHDESWKCTLLFVRNRITNP